MSGGRHGLSATGRAVALLATLLTALLSTASLAAQGAPQLDDAELDRLTAEVADQLRCPVCRNQSVLESSSELARSMQGVIRERLAAGESPKEVKAYFVARYGEWILLRPKARGLNLVAYLLPAVVVLGGGLFVRARVRAWRARRPEAAAARSGKPPTASAAAEAQGEEGLSEPDRDWLEKAIRAG